MGEASSRRSVRIEDVLRDATDDRTALRTFQMLVEELPGGGRGLIGLSVLALAEVATQVAVAGLGAHIVDAAMQAAPIGPLPLLLALVLSGAAYLATRARHRASNRLVHGGIPRAVERVGANPDDAGIEDLSSTPMAELREILMTDIPASYHLLADLILTLVVCVGWTLGSVAVVLWFSPAMLIGLIALAGVFAIAVVDALRRHARLTTERFERLAETSQRAREVVEADRIALTRHLGLGRRFLTRYLSAHGRLTGVQLEQGRLSGDVRASTGALGSIVFLLVVASGGVFIQWNWLDAGGLVAILFVVGRLLGAVARLGEDAGRMAEASTAGRRLAVWWDRQPRDAPTDEPGPGTIDTVQTHGLEVGYRTGTALIRNLDLRLDRGNLAALTAETGAGKSTLALVLTGLFTPRAGTVSIRGDGGSVPPEHCTTGSLMFVGPRPLLVEGSFADNLFLDEPTPQIPRLLEVFADVPGFSTLDDWTRYRVGPSGTGLSSGQAQMLGLSRALVRDPGFIVFDEATSALDLETERRLQTRLLDWCLGRVTLVISHRDCPWLRQATVRLTLADSHLHTQLRGVECASSTS